MSLPPVRRIVTGHTPTGEAIIDSDSQLTFYDPLSEDFRPAPPDGVGFTTIWRTDSIPAKVQGPWIDFQGARIPLSDPVGTTVRIVDFPPGPGIMHRTVSLDFGIVLSGELELVLDNGVKTRVKQHEIVVQRGTIHEWSNPGPESARMLFVLIPSEPARIDGVELEATKLPLPTTDPAAQ